MVSAAIVVDEKLPVTPPMFSVEDKVLLPALEEVCRTQTVWPLLMVLAVEMNVAVQPIL